MLDTFSVSSWPSHPQVERKRTTARASPDDLHEPGGSLLGADDGGEPTNCDSIRLLRRPCSEKSLWRSSY